MQDGSAMALIELQVRDSNGQPRKDPLTLRVDTIVGGVVADFGTLSSKTITTGSDGKVALTYRAPAAPPASQTSDAVVSVLFTPVGTNYGNATPRSIDIRLARPGVLLPPNAPPVPSFRTSPTSVRQGDELFFDASASTDSDGRIMAYTWMFGDDGKSTTTASPTISHTYASAGTFSVQLTVSDDRGASVSMTKDVVITAIENPIAAFDASPTAVEVGSAVNFNGGTSKAGTGHQIVKYDWTFGDGATATGSSALAQHTYDAAGTYSVLLKVTDDTGRVATASKTVTVTAAAAPTAAFFLSPTTVELNKSVTANGSASKAADGHKISKYEWDFGDGSGSFEGGVSVSHSYSSIGTFTVSLKVTDELGRTGVAATQTVTVALSTDPTATFVVSPTTPKPNDVVSVNGSGSKAAGTHSIVKYEWDFGDGSAVVVGGATATHKYTAIGTYAIVLRVTDESGRFGVASQTITVANPAP
jgi:PKD repeat protein